MKELTENSKKLLESRYLRAGETWHDMLLRVSLGNPDYYNAMADLRFLPNSPALINLGRPNASASACFHFDVPDTLQGILDVHNKAALVIHHGGGVGFDFSALRGRGSKVASTHGRACGPVAVMRHYNSLGETLTQGGFREAALMATLDVRHPDIREFIHCKDDDPQSLRNFNISVIVDDDWMKEAAYDECCGDNDKMQLLHEIAESAWRTGDPGLMFRDRVERDNQWPERKLGLNPCAEVLLYDNGVCTLASINLMRLHQLFRNYRSDDFYDAIADTARLVADYLNDVIDNNNHCHPAITKEDLRSRRIGIGVMGFADYIADMRISYDSPYALEVAYKIGRTINQAAQSRNLGNSAMLSIAPTGSISILAGVSSSIEPHFARANSRRTGDGIVLTEGAPEGAKVAHEVHWRDHIKMAAAWQLNVDQGISKTVNMPYESTINDVLDAYVFAWQQDLKTISIFRDGCRAEQILVKECCPECKQYTLTYDAGCYMCSSCGWSACSV